MISLKPDAKKSEVPKSSTGSTISAHELGMPAAAREHMASGKKQLYSEKNAAGALKDFQAATKRAPDYYEAHYETGMAYLALQNTPEGEQQFRKCVELSQRKYGDADIALGTLLLHRNEVKEGEALLREGLALNPNSWPGEFELGELELSQGQAEQALAAAEKAAELAPQQAVVYRLLAIIYLKQQNYAALVSALDSYLALDPDSPAGVRAKELRREAQKHVNNPGAPVSAKN